MLPLPGVASLGEAHAGNHLVLMHCRQYAWASVARAKDVPVNVIPDAL